MRALLGGAALWVRLLGGDRAALCVDGLEQAVLAQASRLSEIAHTLDPASGDPGAGTLFAPALADSVTHLAHGRRHALYVACLINELKPRIYQLDDTSGTIITSLAEGTAQLDYVSGLTCY